MYRGQKRSSETYVWWSINARFSIQSQMNLVLLFGKCRVLYI